MNLLTHQDIDLIIDDFQIQIEKSSNSNRKEIIEFLSHFLQRKNLRTRNFKGLWVVSRYLTHDESYSFQLNLFSSDLKVKALPVRLFSYNLPQQSRELEAYLRELFFVIIWDTEFMQILLESFFKDDPKVFTYKQTNDWDRDFQKTLEKRFFKQYYTAWEILNASTKEIRN